MKIISALLQWAFVIFCVLMLYWAYKIPVPGDFIFQPMTGREVILFSFSIAFVWVEILKWGSVKPFNCVKCLSGWFALLFAFCFHTPHWYLYLPAGVMVGAIYSAIKMRHLD